MEQLQIQHFLGRFQTKYSHHKEFLKSEMEQISKIKKLIFKMIFTYPLTLLTLKILFSIIKYIKNHANLNSKIFKITYI